MRTDGLSRRNFLRTSGIAVTALATGGAMIFGPDHAWAMATTSLDPHTTRTLLVMTYDLFPHPMLGTEYYAKVVDQLDKAAAEDRAIRTLFAEGVTGLDAAHGIRFIDLSEGTREEVLRGIEKTPFFTTVRSKTIVGLYTNPLVYQMFGYGGPSVQLGGYIDRGFDDIGWLPKE